ncbi:ester cyclase [Chitinophaga barathri]|uniref:ABM domain-containing protein n=1 Tax=Chitinophaga barathri TaxID=1647451 RepID=A0A3N4MB18_9BACT|nr:ester cyclase [Chitinophaga barathri]RPD40585.1 hypothetical protein EG028_14900 [Chitinophaga barathri]
MKSALNHIRTSLAILMIPAASFAQGSRPISSPNKTTDNMNTRHNKEIISRLYDEVLNKNNFSILEEFVSENYIGPKGEKGVAGFESNIAPVNKAFPDIIWQITELVGEGDKVAVSWISEGTQQNQFLHIPATHKKVNNNGLSIYYFKEGKIVGSRLQPDRLGVLQQLGVLPQDISKLPAIQESLEQVRFIDKFMVPAAAKDEFMKRTNINRQFIKTLPGFIEDEAYTSTDKDGNLHCVTIATWENAGALQKAKEKVQEFYQKDGFDPAEMLKRLHITMDRAVYTKVQH